ncbi:isochorismatase family protein [Luteipulveratus mongoliensis]|uniref:Isochorismatase-like domain-containing protein n=1 Tax=Luteipulveratus mongoliensis TaxID=571913 RepID=A0A0K1JME9_9MICO|nr:isochorismatase family protein [Luteipulveratus mongoliensis]AKU17886.1 hypothetical protein VV02_21860 [Luteipulveratus mongoliensis]
MDRSPAQALITIDMQHAFLTGVSPVRDAALLMAAVGTQLHAARTTGSLVVHLQNDGASGSPDEPHAPGWALEVPVRNGEPVFRKSSDDGFAGTGLERVLRANGVTTVSICGLLSEMCVAATARTALAVGFEVILAQDAHRTFDIPDEGPHRPSVSSHLVSRVAEWSLGDQPRFVAYSTDVAFERP